MRIKRKFIQLTKKTYPRGTEKQLRDHLPKGHKQDLCGNYYIVIGENPTTMFACHLDTYTKTQQTVKHRYYGNMILTDGSSILGADDKAGMVVMLYMIEKKKPGLYYFFIAEESGCIGSKNLVRAISENKPALFETTTSHIHNIKRCISFDRRGTTSIITEQNWKECCSEDFAHELAYRLNKCDRILNYRPDPNGYSTDSGQFVDLIPECTNISVGYYDEHTISERQDINHLYRLCKASVSIDWETLPVARDPNAKFDAKGYWDDWHDSPYDRSFGVDIKNEDYCEDFYAFKIDPSGVRRKAYISKLWVYHEEWLIRKGLEEKGIKIKSLKWDGMTCWINEEFDGQSSAHPKRLNYSGGRTDMAPYLWKWGEIPEKHYMFEDDSRLRKESKFEFSSF